ncbi:MAG: HAD family hydrolase [Proteobacteria bacterium]|nr:HAD family hydrolase [Pseudomonadota bacterium]
MKKVFSFDLDGTLVNAGFGDMVWNHGIPEAYAKKYSMPFDDARMLITKEYASVGDSSILWYQIDYWLKKFNLQVTAGELLKKYETFIELIPGAKEVIERLKETYTLVIASNAARIFVEKELEYTDLARYFSHSISATTDYNMVKKETAFYEMVCSILNVLPEEVIHVGDHEIFDFKVPSDMGIEAYYFRNSGSGNMDKGPRENNGRVIQNLLELLDKI